MTRFPQPYLFFDQPGSHRNDPVTSYIAAEKLAKSGKWTGQKQEVYEALKAALKQYKGGATSAEVAAFMDGCDPVNRFTAARRLPELEKIGLVKKGIIRQCTTTGSLCVTWEIKP